MRLSTEVLRATYDFLRLTAPFTRWKLPPGERVKLIVNESEAHMGDHYLLSDGTHRIRISSKFHGLPDTLLKTMAHEMIHLRQAIIGVPIEHDNEFMRMWRLVCRHHGFDPKNP